MAKFTRREKNRPVPKLEPRIAGLIALMVAVLITASPCACTTCRSSCITNIAELADRNRIRIQRVPAPRGLVFDRQSPPAGRYQSVVRRGDRARGLATIFPRPSSGSRSYTGPNDIAEKIADADEAGRPPYEPVTVAERLDGSRSSRSKRISSSCPASVCKSRRGGITCTARSRRICSATSAK